MIPAPLFLALAAAAASPFPAVTMDERVELVSAAALLAGGDRTASGFYEHPIPYARRLRRELGPSSGHPAVKTLDERLRQGLSSQDLYELALRLSSAPPYALQSQLPDPIARKLGGAAGAAAFLAQLEDFARASDFAGFWERGAADRRPLLAAAENSAADPTLRSRLESYTGAAAPPFTVIVSPEAEPVFAVTVRDGAGAVTSIFGPQRFRRDWLMRPKLRFEVAGRLSDLWREAMLSQLASAGITGDEAREAAMAATARLQWLTASKEMGELALVKYARVGQPRLRAMFDRLAAYEADRKRYPTLASFYPELIRARAEDASVSDFSGGLEALWSAKDALTAVIPGGEAGPLAAGVRSVWPQAKLVDAAAPDSDLSGAHVVVVGRREDNAWLRRHWDELRLPLRLTREGLSWSRKDREAKSYELAGRLGVITVGRHPSDRLRGALVFTAAESSAVPSLSPRSAPDLDFLVLSGADVVKAGRYEKSLLPWRPR
jgi:hypothetical protein